MNNQVIRCDHGYFCTNCIEPFFLMSYVENSIYTYFTWLTTFP